MARALTRLQPDIVLVEGPPEADGVVPLAANEFMRPPVALLVYMPDEPRRGVFYPFADFSPEWSAIRYALDHEIPMRFIDLPQSHQIALEAEREANPTASSIPHDPLGMLAEAAGFPDGERWWEAAVEHRQNDDDLFKAIQEAMTALRAELAPITERIEVLREAFMRQTIRKARLEGYKNIAVVCGAWHGPALAEMPSVKSDAFLLQNLPKVKTAATWVPWSNARLAMSSGYGAGIQSPGWYGHLWKFPDGNSIHWITNAAHLLRNHDLPSSPAHIIEAVRLSDTLAALRGKSIPDLAELNDAIQTVFCNGSNLQIRLILEKLIIGDILGLVPDETPMVPLQKDFERLQKRLRLPSEVVKRTLDLDLRNTNDLERSLLLHRSIILGIPWGNTERVRRAKGTFHELWTIQWEPDFVIALIEASMWGNTVVDAAEARAVDLSLKAPNLPALTVLLDNALLAELPSAVRRSMERIQEESALTSDILQLMDALPALTNIVRYGNVRNTDVEQVAHIVSGLVVRIAVGLPIAVSSLNDDAAMDAFNKLVTVNAALNLNDNVQQLDLWLHSVQSVAEQHGVHGLIAGRCTRILLDSGRLDSDYCADHMQLALGIANDQLYAAAWIEGFLEKSGQLLLLDKQLFAVVDEWLQALSDESFLNLLPLIKRTFSTFTAPERRQIGEQVKAGRKAAVLQTLLSKIDIERADAVLPFLRLLLGLDKETV